MSPEDHGAAAFGDEDQHASTVRRIGATIDQGVRHHAVNHLRQRRVIEECGLGQVAHGPAIVLAEQGKDPPLLNRNALGAELVVELFLNLTIGLRQQIGNMLADGACTCHGGEHPILNPDFWH